MRQLLSEWRQYLLEAEAKYSGIIKITPSASILKQVKDLQDKIKDSTAVTLPEKAIHVTAVHQDYMKPYRKKLKNIELPQAPDPIIDFEKGIEIKKSGNKKSWAVPLKNQQEMREYVKNIMEMLGNPDTNPEPERVFHISLANLTGNPHDSVR